MKAESHSLHRKTLALRSFTGETFYESPHIYMTALTKGRVGMQYHSRMITWPKSPEAALEEGMRLAERLNRERLGGQGKILGVRKSVEGEDYAIYMEVPRRSMRTWTSPKRSARRSWNSATAWACPSSSTSSRRATSASATCPQSPPWTSTAGRRNTTKAC